MSKNLNLLAMMIGGIVIFSSLALLQAKAKEKDNTALSSDQALLAQRVLENSTEQMDTKKTKPEQQTRLDRATQDSLTLTQLRQAAALSEQEYAALSAEERQKYQQLQASVSKIVQQLEETELERQRLYNAVEQMNQENEVLNREIDAMRPALLEVTLEAEKQSENEVLVSNQSKQNSSAR